MESQEVLMNGGVSNGCYDFVYENGFEKVNSENGLMEMGGDGVGKGNLADEVLVGLEEYWEDINDRLMISRMVSNSVIKGIVTAVEQEAAAKIASKEMEIAKLKNFMQSREIGPSKDEDVRNLRLSCFADAFVEHEKMREDLHALRDWAKEQLKKAKKEIDFTRGSNSIKKNGSGSELVGLGGILQEKQCENGVHYYESLKTTIDTVCTKVDAILISSKTTICESQQDLDILAKVEDVVMQSVFRSLREEFKANFREQNARFCEIQNVNWLEKFNNMSGLGTQLDAILKSLSVSEPGLVSHGSHDLDHLHQKAFNNHVSPIRENGTVEAAEIHVAESYDYQQLKHMPKEELVNYFNNIITKIKRDHEAVLQQKTEEYFRVKREYLKEKGSFMTLRKDIEFDVLRRKIPEVISKLEDFLLENEKFPALTNNLESMEQMKNRVECLLSENRQLRDCLTDRKNEVKCLEAQVLEHSLAEENMLKVVENLKSAMEDSSIEVSINEGVYKFALREQIAETRCDSEDSNMEFLAPATNRNEIEDSDLESLAMQELSGLILTGVTKDAEKQLDNLYQEILIDKEIKVSLESKALKLENELRVEVEQKEKLKQEILYLETIVNEKGKLATDLSISLSKEREKFELASQELSSLREQAAQQQQLLTESNMDLQSLRSQYLEALEQIEVDKKKMNMLNQKLDQTKEGLREAYEERDKAYTLTQEMHDKLLLSEAREETLKMGMKMAADGVSNMFDDFESRVSGVIIKNKLRFEDTSSHLKALNKMANSLRKKGLMYKQKLDRKCTDLQMAESEVDLLGDEVDALLRLLEKIYIALDHYSPVLKHYPGIIEILELVRRELSGESTKLS